MSKVYTVKEVAEILQCNQDYVHKLRKSGQIKFMKLGHYKVREEELERFLRDAEGYDMTDPDNPKPLREADCDG